MLASEAFPSANATFVSALAWRSIFRAVRAEILVADHAPVALLAARGTELRTVACGIPFSIPPVGRPLPRFLKSASDARVREAKLLKRLNSVLSVLRGPKLDRASELYRAAATAVMTVPELDFFGPRPQDDYVGPALADAGDAVPAWPKARGTKFLVYVRPSPHLAPLFEALERSRASVIAHVPNSDRAFAKSARERGFHLSETPLKLSELLPRCDAVVCHGGNLSAAAALAGKPLLMCPLHIEHQLAASWAAKQGIAVVSAGKPDAASMLEHCEALRPGGEPSRRAAAFAKEHAPHHRTLGVPEIVRKIEALHREPVA
jgi:UDP:flavonoid glycosyltransferase YjiC (YdhE family)